jgi:hypothetical protein
MVGPARNRAVDGRSPASHDDGCLSGQKNASSNGRDNSAPTGFVGSESSCPPGAMAGRTSRQESRPARSGSVACPPDAHQPHWG